MRYSITSGMVLAAMTMTIGETVAGPTHAHLHRRAHDLQKKTDWNDASNYEGVDFAKAYAEGVASKASDVVAAVASPVVAAVAGQAAQVTASSAASSSTAKSSATSSASSSSPSSILTALWNDIIGASNARSSFGPGIAPVGTPGDNYFGNYGGTGDNYGSNVIMVDSIGDNDFTNTFKNTQSKAITVNVWNKVGPDYEVLSGSALAPTRTTLTFVLQPGASQIVAFQDISNIGWAEAVDEYTAASAFKTSWGEANFCSTGSGYDLSAINSDNTYQMTITSTQNAACTSDPTQNMWLTASDPVGSGDGSCYVPAGPMHLQTIMGGS
ncbi:hypothetical protein LOCC1_G003216 [Lachnellula occidentalis]|uniref:Allergen Asp f 4 n=1 Tax=Lachnellula occidentalis TaxID=215460 RepID=A0A8H8S0N7_9HELO|nr:hypothetical protein LOCC1_G003216 [Lachnellula occidentalis]